MMLRLGLYECDFRERVAKIEEFERKIKNARPFPTIAVSCRTCKSAAFRHDYIGHDSIRCLKKRSEFHYCYNDDGRSGRCEKWVACSDFLRPILATGPAKETRHE